MYTYFKDKAKQEEFEKKGFVKFNVLDTEAIDVILKLYKTVKPFYLRSTFCNLYSRKEATNITVSNTIKKYVNKFVADNLVDCEAVGGCYIAKGTGSKTNVDYHQDWAITDENKYFSLAVWIPLTKTTKENGALAIIPGSHKWPNIIRSYSLPSIYVGLDKIAEGDYETINLEAGEAVIYAQNIFHASWPNMSKQNRIAVNVTVMPNAAERLFFHKEHNDRTKAYAMPENFQNHMIGKLKSGQYPAALQQTEFNFEGYGNMTPELFFDLLKKQ